MAQGRAYSFVTFNILYAGFEDPESSTVAGKVGITPNSGRRPERRLGLGHSQFEPERGSRMDLHQVGRRTPRPPSGARCSAALRRRRRSSPIPTWKAARPYYPVLGEILAGTQDFPVFTYTTEFVEEVGRELNLAAIGEEADSRGHGRCPGGASRPADQGRQDRRIAAQPHGHVTPDGWHVDADTAGPALWVSAHGAGPRRVGGCRYLPAVLHHLHELLRLHPAHPQPRHLHRRGELPGGGRGRSTCRARSGSRSSSSSPRSSSNSLLASSWRSRSTPPSDSRRSTT